MFSFLPETVCGWMTCVGGGGYTGSIPDVGGVGKCSALFSSSSSTEVVVEKCSGGT